MGAEQVLDFLARGAVLLALLAFVQFLLRSRSASLRYVLARTALGALLLLPLLARFGPELDVAVPVFAAQEPAFQVPARARMSLEAVSPTPIEVVPRRFELRALVVPLWLAGSLALVMLHVLRRLVLAQHLRQGTPLEGEIWRRCLGRAAAAVGLRRPVRLVASAAVPVPLALGWIRPALLMPARACAWDEGRLEAVLRHELVHVRRADELWHVLAVLVRALHWPNPLAWLAVARLEREREESCDERVLLSGLRASVYATHLLGVARELETAPPFLLRGAPALARSTDVTARVRAVLAASAAPRAGARSLGLVVLSAAAVALPLAALRAELTEVSALQRVREFVALRGRPALDPATLALLLEALGDDRRVDPRAVPLADGGPRQGNLPETTPGKEAARVLVQQGGRALDGLLRALDDGRAPAREKAAWALGCSGACAPALAARLARDPSPGVRRIAAWALGEMGARGERAALETALGDPVDAVRAQAAHALGDLRDGRAVPVLLFALHDPAATVRERAAHALGDLARRSSVPALRAALDEPEPEVREMVRWALRECGEEDS